MRRGVALLFSTDCHEICSKHDLQTVNPNDLGAHDRNYFYRQQHLQFLANFAMPRLLKIKNMLDLDFYQFTVKVSLQYSFCTVIT